MTKLEALLKEWKRRKKQSPETALQKEDASPNHVLADVMDPLKSWEEKRKRFKALLESGYDCRSGEILNFMDGLTPDGYNRKGRKVSFVETGKTMFRGPILSRGSNRISKQDQRHAPHPKRPNDRF